MTDSTTERILILYSNPSDTGRIRLDKEHRAIDQVLEILNLPLDTITRRHAATYNDLIKTLVENEYTVVQFSGHGSGEGILLEAEESQVAQLVGADRIARLLSETQPNLRLSVFMSCFSADALPSLASAAPYLLTVFGEADDSASIEFVKRFYQIYLRDGSVERACFLAQEFTEGKLQIVLSRRALDKKTVLFQVFPRGNHLGDSFLIDLSDAERDIESLGLPREGFLSVLSRKIRVHARIFDAPREYAILPIGQFIGVFSWSNASDVIECHRILKIKPEVTDEVFDVWAWLAVQYNDLASAKYRLIPQTTAPAQMRIMEIALKSLRFSNLELSGKNTGRILSEHVPEQYKLSRSVMSANLAMAETKLYAEDFRTAVIYLEGALSCMHDLLDALTSKLTVNP